jgi:hypothetical protein
MPETTTDPVLDRAARLAGDDAEVADLLGAHAHSRPVATWYDGAPERGILVTTAFEEPVPVDEWPSGEVCAIDGASGDMHGVAWLLDQRGERIRARSPIWEGGVRCF